MLYLIPNWFDQRPKQQQAKAEERITPLWLLRSSLLVLGLLLAGLAWAGSDKAQAPSFALPDLNSGQTVHLQDFRGKVVYLDFWASWCGPCRKSLPLLNSLRNEFKDSGRFEVVAVNVDADPEDGRHFLKQFPVSYPVLSDPLGSTPALYQLVGMPTSFLLDENGQIHSVQQGFHSSELEQLRSTIKSLIAAGDKS